MGFNSGLKGLRNCKLMFFPFPLILNTDSVTENLEIEIMYGKFSKKRIFFLLAKNNSSTQIFLVRLQLSAARTHVCVLTILFPCKQ
jgi:hypothetical protein